MCLWACIWKRLTFSRLSKEICPHQCGWASSNVPGAQMEQNSKEGKTLSSWAGMLIFFCPQTPKILVLGPSDLHQKPHSSQGSGFRPNYTIGCQINDHKLGNLNTRNLLFQFWRPEVQNQGIGRVGSLQKLQGESITSLSSSFWWLLAIVGLGMQSCSLCPWPFPLCLLFSYEATHHWMWVPSSILYDLIWRSLTWL